MDHKEVIRIVKQLAAQSPCDWDSRVQAMEAAKVAEAAILDKFESVVKESKTSSPTP